MADSSHVDSNITTTATDGAGNIIVSVSQSNITESNSVESSITTGGRGEKGDTGDTGPAGVVQSIVAGNNIDIDNTDPTNPVVSVETLTLSDVSDVTASATELNYTDGVTSAIQTQIDGKSSTAHTHVLAAGATDVTSSAAELNILDGATLSTTELNYVDGVTSAIQTQLDGKVDENSSITGATKTKITYDAKGLVTAGADATTADIADSTNKRYVTDAQLTVIGNTSGTNTGDQDLSGYVPTSRTVNSKALSSNVTLNQDDVGDGSTYKQYSSTEKTKLSGIASGATANDTDANLKNRANHTGTQALSTISDVTATASEVNVLDGITATTAELNYTDGVTSAIQTQLDTKAATTYVDAGDATKQPKFMTGTIATAAGTTAKTVTLNSPWDTYTPVAGDWFVFTFTLGQTASGPTIAINGGSALTIYTPQGSTSSSFLTLAATGTLLLYYNGTLLQTYGTNAGEISTTNIVNTTSSTQGNITGRRAEDLMVNEATKTRTLTNKTLTSPLVNTIYDTNGNKSLQLNATPSAVNYLYVVNGATGNSISFRANGTDTNISIGMFSKGSGQVQLRSDTNGFILAGDSVASGVNYVGLTNAATGSGPSIAAVGTDTDVHLNLKAKGAGNIQIPTGTGAALFNTADQTTNYERVRHYWSGNIYNIMSEAGGTGTRRVMYMSALSSSTAGLKLNTSTVNGVLEATNTSSTAGAINLKVSGTWTASSGVQYGTTIVPTVNQTSTAGYTALLVNPTETGVGSGSNLLADFQVGGTSKVSIKNDGVIFPVQAATASAPTYVKGGVYFDTTLNKLRVGGASGWETITST